MDSCRLRRDLRGQAQRQVHGMGCIPPLPGAGEYASLGGTAGLYLLIEGRGKDGEVRRQEMKGCEKVEMPRELGTNPRGLHYYKPSPI